MSTQAGWASRHSAHASRNVPKEIEAIHLANGWSGVGYHFIVSQAGEILEGRGWDKVGAHCPGHNTDGLGIYIGVGGDQEPTEAAKRAARWLYDEACRRTGKGLAKSWHGYDYPTACPGPKLIAWVKTGMPVSGATPAKTSAAQTYAREDVARLQRVLGLDDTGIWDGLTERQALALRRTLKPGMKPGVWDRVRYGRPRRSRPRASRRPTRCAAPSSGRSRSTSMAIGARPRTLPGAPCESSTSDEPPRPHPRRTDALHCRDYDRVIARALGLVMAGALLLMAAAHRLSHHAPSIGA